MRKIDPVVIKETTYVAIWTILLSVIMQAVFLIIQKWDYTVLLGNILSGVVAVLNFFLLGLTVQFSVGKDEKDIKNYAKLSQMLRLLMIAVVLCVGVLLDCFNTWSVIIPVIFPRIALLFRPLFGRKKQ